MKLLCAFLLLLVAACRTPPPWGWLTADDYRRMLDELEKSPDVELPESKGNVDYALVTSDSFVCSACGRTTLHWCNNGRGVEHFRAWHQFIDMFRSRGCDAKLDDTCLCRYCHPERFTVERRPATGILKRGLQDNLPHDEFKRYVPKDLVVSVKNWTPDGSRYALKTGNAYSIVERSLVGSDGRMVKDVRALSFVPVIGNALRLDETSGEWTFMYGQYARSISKGEAVVVEDMPPPVGGNLTGTNDWARYCLVTTPAKKTSSFWGCVATAKNLEPLQCETRVVSSSYPVFLSVNGGPRKEVGLCDLLVLLAFLDRKPFAEDWAAYYCTTKSRAKWLRELLLPESAKRDDVP